MVYINECIDVNTTFKKNSFKSMSCLWNFPTLVSPRLYLVILSNLCSESCVNKQLEKLSSKENEVKLISEAQINKDI